MPEGMAEHNYMPRIGISDPVTDFHEQPEVPADRSPFLRACQAVHQRHKAAVL
jgi:hypothetical protein